MYVVPSHLMTLEHVQAQQHVHGLLSQHCET